jgi:DNA-binding response OmpR family regulator
MTTGDPCKILIVDDEPAVGALIGAELRQQGHACTLATGPEQAIALLDGGAFDLVITDIA